MTTLELEPGRPIDEDWTRLALALPPADRHELLDRVEDLFEGDDDLLRVCAWCGRVRSGEGAWIPVGPDLPVRGPFQASHGICEECREDMRDPAEPE